MWWLLTAFAIEPEICDGIDNDLNGIIDDGVSCPCPVFQDAGGNAYLVCTARAPRDEAIGLCEDNGYELADIESAQETTEVNAFLDPTENYWIAIEDVDDTDTYVHGDGSALSYTNWGVNQPDGGDQDCMILFWEAMPRHAWHDVPCTSNYVPLCEATCTPVTWYEDLDGDGYGTGLGATGCAPLPPGAATMNGDCDDTDDDVHPGATEFCNGVDDDCDGSADEPFPDADGDGFVECQGDCDDNDPGRHPEADEICDGVDQNCDGEVDEGLDGDGDGITICAGDCDDANPDIFPAAEELSAAIDHDCDGDSSDVGELYRDADGDGFGSVVDPAGTVLRGGDCDDLAGAVKPDALETCNGIDDDCDGFIDEGGTCDGCVPFDLPTGRYLRCDEPEDFADAVGACKDMGWQLAAPDSTDAEADIIQVIRSGPHRDWWHGAVDSREEDVWVTLDGSPATVSWEPGQPNDINSGQDCTALIVSGADLVVVDHDCNDREAFICETCTQTRWYADADGDGVGSGEPVFSCHRPMPGFVIDDGDCDDTDPRIRPGVVEICDNLDNDCNGVSDDGPVLSGTDADGDGFIGALELVATCPPTDLFAGDCDDGDPERTPLAAEVCNGLDDDCDGFIDEEACACEVMHTDVGIFQMCDRPPNNLDYADSEAACASDGYGLAALHDPEKRFVVSLETHPSGGTPVFMGLQEVGGTWTWSDGSTVPPRWANDQPNGNGICGGFLNQIPWGRVNDDECDDVGGRICEVECTYRTVYRDRDGDGVGQPGETRVTCGPAVGWSESSADCDDSAGWNAPGFQELCDGLDNDCDGVVDNDISVTLWYADGDGDGYGDPLTEVESCAPPQGYVELSGDCDDADDSRNPNALEECDGIDNNCDGQTDEDAVDGVPGYLDIDGDSFGDPGTFSRWCPDEVPMEFVENSSDCDDTNADISPAALEICGPDDEDCDGLVDDADPSLDPSTTLTWYPDLDGDGFGDSAGATVSSCDAPDDHVAEGTDCDDTAPGTFPGGLDIPGDGIDQDCDGMDVPLDADSDGDGLLDAEEIAIGSDPTNPDSDGDGILDPDELDANGAPQDSDSDSVPDILDPDDDGDGVPTADERLTDTDGDGAPDYLDPDSDDDGALDGTEGLEDSDGDGTPDRYDPGGEANTGEAPPEPEYGCGCRTGGQAGWFALIGVLAYRSRRRAAISRRAR